MELNIANIRQEYKLASLSASDCAQDPFLQFDAWWKDAVNARVDEVNAMTLATASADGLPSARIVLLKDFSREGFVFFTNYQSFKGSMLEENPRACLVFFWKELQRQVRITGLVKKISAEESDDYFSSRPNASQISAIISPQSRVVPSREWLEEQYLRVQHAAEQLSRPAHWGGFRVEPVTVEFWQGRASRLHDRLQYKLDENGNWAIERLAP